MKINKISKNETESSLLVNYTSCLSNKKNWVICTLKHFSYTNAAMVRPPSHVYLSTSGRLSTCVCVPPFSKIVRISIRALEN